MATKVRYGIKYETRRSPFKTWEITGDSDQRYFEDWRGWVVIAFIVMLVISVIAAITGVVVSVRAWDHHQAQHSCELKSVKTGLDTQFIDLGFWNYDCYVTLSNGDLIPYGKVRVDLPA